MRKLLLALIAASPFFAIAAFADTGTVKVFNFHQGYGFIAPLHGVNELFFHAGSIANPAEALILEAGQCVRFDVKEISVGKWAAENVRRIECHENR